MALIVRRYIRNALSTSDLDRAVQLGAVAVDSNETFADIQVDDATPGIADMLDAYMLNLGYGFLGQSPGASLVNVSPIGSFNAVAATIPGAPSTPAAIGSRNSVLTVDYGDAANESAWWLSSVPQSFGGGDITALLDWIADGATTGDVVWGISFAVLDPGDNIDTASFGSESQIVASAPATNGVIARTPIAHPIPFTTAEVKPGNAFVARIRRLGNEVDDTMTGNAQLLQLQLYGPA